MEIPVSDQQEWTSEWLSNQVGHFSISQQSYERTCELHNAALAAERGKLEIEHEARLVVVDELAAERQRREKADTGEQQKLIDSIVGDLVMETNILPNQVERSKELIWKRLNGLPCI